MAEGQAGVLEFFNLFLPSLVNFLVPASLMHFSVPKGVPDSATEFRRPKHGGVVVIWLFALGYVASIFTYLWVNASLM